MKYRKKNVKANSLIRPQYPQYQLVDPQHQLDGGNENIKGIKNYHTEIMH